MSSELGLEAQRENLCSSSEDGVSGSRALPAGLPEARHEMIQAAALS